MRALLLATVLAVGGFAIATPVSVAPASAQVIVDTPIGGVRVGPSRRHRDYERRRYRERCRTTIIRRADGSTTRIRRCR